MGTQAPKRHQHTTPKVYLRGFADADQKVTILRRSKEQRDVHISHVGVRSGFYNVRSGTGASDDGVENWFMSAIESPVGSILHRLREAADDGVIAAGEAPPVANFVAAQLLRTATARSYYKQIDRHLTPRVLASVLPTTLGLNARSVPVAQLDRLLHRAGESLLREQDQADLRASHLRTTLREIDKLMARFAAWRWRVLHSRHPRLITGDAPAVAIQPRLGHFAGIAPRGSPVYLPLTPTRLLVGIEPEGEMPRELTTRLARLVNGRVAWEADDAVVKATSQEWPKRLRLRPHSPLLAAPAIRLSRPGETPPTRSDQVPLPTTHSIQGLLIGTLNDRSIGPCLLVDKANAHQSSALPPEDAD